jgi:catechol 2,3-dioxygenase-like lactoylglutathione lyase family enzyme
LLIDDNQSTTRSNDGYAKQGAVVDYKLELIVIPVTDMDRAKAFYSGQVGFHVDVDHRAGEDFRVIQLTPPGSACSITLMRNTARAGAIDGLHLVVEDIEIARADLASRDVEISEPFHFGPEGQLPGLDPERRKYGSFASFSDPDGNGWLLQEVTR